MYTPFLKLEYEVMDQSINTPDFNIGFEIQRLMLNLT